MDQDGKGMDQNLKDMDVKQDGKDGKDGKDQNREDQSVAFQPGKTTDTKPGLTISVESSRSDLYNLVGNCVVCNLPLEKEWQLTLRAWLANVSWLEKSDGKFHLSIDEGKTVTFIGICPNLTHLPLHVGVVIVIPVTGCPHAPFDTGPRFNVQFTRQHGRLSVVVHENYVRKVRIFDPEHLVDLNSQPRDGNGYITFPLVSGYVLRFGGQSTRMNYLHLTVV